MHFPFVCVGSDWPYASNQQSHILLHITLLTSDKCTTGRGIYTHTNTCSPAHVQHAYNDIKTKLHNTLTHNGEYTTTYFSPLKHKQVGNLEFLYIPITLFLYSLPIQFSIMPDQSGHPKWSPKVMLS